MKKILFFAATVAMMASCADSDLIENGGQSTGQNGAIGFVMQNKNMTRSYSDLQTAGHYNFGVFAYKSTDKVNPVMPNYLVGYYDNAKAYQETGTTVGDQAGVADGKSYWMYEGMGNTEYKGTYAGAALDAAHTSNNPNQYLKYWDMAAAHTYFYAYAPYINGGVGVTATYVDGVAQTDKSTGNDTYVLTIPNGTIQAQMVEDGEPHDMYEYMYASKKVAKADYGHDVALEFHRLNAKVNIKFWEDVPGYKVRIIDLGGNNSYKGVHATAAVKNPDFPAPASAAPYNTLSYSEYGYAGGKYYSQNGVKIHFNDGVKDGMKQFVGTEQTNANTLQFTAPTEAQIGETRFTAAKSPSTYYAVPKGQGENLLANTTTDYSDAGAAEDAIYGVTGFTFHVSYELTAEDTGERIVVKNATVHVPYGYCNWKGNTHYTYIFKITQNSNGSTDPDQDNFIDTDPDVPTTPALYPIVFDNCTVQDWDEDESEWNITDGTTLAYHNITLKESSDEKYSYNAAAHTINVSIVDADRNLQHAIAYNAYDKTNATTMAKGGIEITAPDGTTDVTSMYTAGAGDPATAGTIAITTSTAAGVYTITYHCPAGANNDINHNHPATWTQTFFVGDEYTVSTHHATIGTKFTEASAKLTISTKKNSVAETTAGMSGQLKIEYPTNFTTTELEAMKAAVKVVGQEVVVTNAALPGVYKLVYTINEGKEVKVASCQFTVVDYTLAMSPAVVYNYGSDMMVYGNQTASSDASSDNVYTTDNANCTVTDNEITAATAITDNTVVTVTYTVWDNGGAADVAKTTYTATFKVYDTHAVAVDKSSIDRNLGTHADGDYTTDNIVISTTHNGIATGDVHTSLSIVKSDKTDTAAGDFTITYTSANKYNLKVKNNVAPGTYYVKYVSTVGGSDKSEYVQFVVTE